MNLSIYLLLTCACAYSYNAWQDLFETMGQFVDGLKFSGGSHSLMPKSSIKEVIDMAHKHDVYVSTGDWAEHLLRKDPSAPRSTGKEAAPVLVFVCYGYILLENGEIWI